MSLSAVSDITVERVVKKKTPKKHYVFSIQVEWKDGVIIRIYRSYDDTLSLQRKLQKMEEFNSYLANESAENRNGYLLQDRSLFGKLTIRTSKQARRRMIEVEEFMKSVVHLPSYISRSDVVIAFFRPVPDDLMFVEPDSYGDSIKETRESRRKDYLLHISEPILLDQYVAICDYTKVDKNDLNLKAGNIVDVIYKAEHGWWFVDLDGDLGWVPASYLESRDGDMDDQTMETFKDGQEEIYIAMGTYEPEFDDEMKLEVGKVVQVKQKKIDGWWLVKCDESIGWVPCMHLRELSTSSTNAYARELGREKAVMTMNNLFAITDRRRTWNPTLPPKRLSTFKSTMKRRRFDIEEKIQEEEEKPSYMNMEFHKKNQTPTTQNNNNNNNNNNKGNEKEAGPSYINMEFHTKTKKNVKRTNNTNKKEKEAAPSYINMEFHKNNEQVTRQRARRHRDDDEDFVEIDFNKIKELSSQSKEIPEEAGSEEKDISQETTKSRSDSEDGYESPPDFPGKQQGAKKPQKTEGLGQESEKGTSRETSLEEKHNENVKETLKPDPVMQVSEPKDETTVMTGGNNIFLAIDDYTKESETEVNLQTGTSVEVLEQSEGGWWLVRTQSLSIGWAPSNFLEKISNEELDRRKQLGLEAPERPPVRPPKSSRVHRMALHVSTEQKFWSFMRKNDPNDAKCSIVDENQICRVNNSEEEHLTVMDSYGNKLGSAEDIKKEYICDLKTGVCEVHF